MDDFRHCPKCGQNKLTSEFAKNKNKKDGLGSWCKSCTNVIVKLWYDKPENKLKHKNKLLNRRELNKKKLVEHFGNRCLDCDNSYPSCCYDFHHLDGSTKENSFANMNTNGWESISKEIIGKCVMLCSNCHRIRHYEQS